MQLAAVSTLAALACYAAGAFAASSVNVTTLRQNGTETEGWAAVAANGTLSPFGDIGVGCGINWQDETNFGGGLQAGSSTLGLGLGGGWNIGPHNMTAGIGIGLPQNAKANISVALDYSGGVEFRLVSSTPLECNPSQDRSGANYYISCKSTKSG